MDKSFIAKLKRVYAYLFKGFPFENEAFDYDGYWDELSRSEEHPASQFKLKLIEGLIERDNSKNG